MNTVARATVKKAARWNGWAFAVIVVIALFGILAKASDAAPARHFSPAPGTELPGLPAAWEKHRTGTGFPTGQ